MDCCFCYFWLKNLDLDEDFKSGIWLEREKLFLALPSSNIGFTNVYLDLFNAGNEGLEEYRMLFFTSIIAFVSLPKTTLESFE